MYKRLAEHIRKLRGRKNIDEAELKKERRYVYEKDAYKIYPIKWTQQEEGFLENGHKKKG